MFLNSGKTNFPFPLVGSQTLTCHTETCESGRDKEATTAVVCVVCSFTAGLLLGVLLTQCHGHCHRKGKRGQTEIPSVFPLENTPAIELTSIVAYGPTSM